MIFNFDTKFSPSGARSDLSGFFKLKKGQKMIEKITEPIRLRDGMRLLFPVGTELHSACGIMFLGEHVKDVELIGYGSTLHLESTDGFRILGCENVTIRGFKLNCSKINGLESDGVHIARYAYQKSRNIKIHHLVIDNPPRNGISVIGVDGLLIEDCMIKNAKTMSPMCGIDIEPNHQWEVLRNIKIKNCYFTGNKGRAIYINGSDVIVSPVNIEIDNILIENDSNFCIGHDAENQAQGNILTATIKRVRMINCTGGFYLGCREKYSYVSLQDCYIENPTSIERSPVWIYHNISGHKAGGIRFDNMIVKDTIKRNCCRIHPMEGEVGGTLFYDNPNLGNFYPVGLDAQDQRLTVDARPVHP